jgi:hypothetical protein
LESGNGTLDGLASGCQVNGLWDGTGGNIGTGCYNFWLQTNYAGTVTFADCGLTISINYALRVDNPSATFCEYASSLSDGLWGLQAGGKVMLIGDYLGQCSLSVPAGGQLVVAQSALGNLLYVPQAGTINWATNCLSPGTSFIAAYAPTIDTVPDGMTVDTNNLAKITAALLPANGANNRPASGLVTLGWHLQSGSNFTFHVPTPGFTFTNGGTVTIKLSYLEDTDGSLAVYYDSTNGLKLGATYTMFATNAQWNGRSLTVGDARFSGTNVADILLTVSNSYTSGGTCDPVVSSVALYATNYLGVPPPILPAHFTGAPPLLTWSLLAPANLALAGNVDPANAGLPYWLRSTTNVALSLSQWDWVATNVFNPDGSFSNSLPRPPGDPQRFYRLQTR